MEGNALHTLAATSQVPEDRSPLPSPPRACLPRASARLLHLRLMYASTALYFAAIGLTSISLIFLINHRIAGDASDPTHGSIFVQTTGVFLNNASSFIFLRYNSGLGDFMGRKPIICLSAFSMIITRTMYIRAHLPAHFFVIAILAGATESFYFSTLAWVCDIFPNHAERSKYYGIFTGIAGLFGVVIGAPIGAALSIAVSPIAPFIVSLFFSFASFLITMLNPCPDTLALKAIQSDRLRMITKTRAIPTSAYDFIVAHFPISKSSVQLILESKSCTDWLTFFLAQWTWAIMPLILVQFLLKVFDWSRAISALCLLVMGLSLGLLTPMLQSYIEPTTLSFYSMGVEALGFLLLCISGTGVNHFHKIGIAGLTCVALGLAWLPCSQSIIMSGYDFGKQGVVSGLVGQMNDFAVLPAYLISLSFTFNLERGSGHVYFPGCAFGICSVVLVIAMSLHYKTHGSSALTLRHRKHFKDGKNVEIPNNIKVFEDSEEAQNYNKTRQDVASLAMVSPDTKKTDISEEEESAFLP